MLTMADVDVRIGSDTLKNMSQITESDYAKLPVTEFIMTHTFWVGCAQNLTEEDTAKTVQVIHQFVESKVK